MTLGWWRPGRAPFLSRAGSLGFCTGVNSGPRRGIRSECPWCVQPLGARRRAPPKGCTRPPSSWKDPGREYGRWVGPRATGLGSELTTRRRTPGGRPGCLELHGRQWGSCQDVA